MLTIAQLTVLWEWALSSAGLLSLTSMLWHHASSDLKKPHSNPSLTSWIFIISTYPSWNQLGIQFLLTTLCIMFSFASVWISVTCLDMSATLPQHTALRGNRKARGQWWHLDSIHCGHRQLFKVTCRFLSAWIGDFVSNVSRYCTWMLNNARLEAFGSTVTSWKQYSASCNMRYYSTTVILSRSHDCSTTLAAWKWLRANFQGSGVSRPWRSRLCWRNKVTRTKVEKSILVHSQTYAVQHNFMHREFPFKSLFRLAWLIQQFKEEKAHLCACVLFLPLVWV